MVLIDIYNLSRMQDGCQWNMITGGSQGGSHRYIYNLSIMQGGFQWNMITGGSQRHTTCPGKFQTPSFLNFFFFFVAIFCAFLT